MFGDAGIDDLGEYIGRKMNLQHSVAVELQVATEYYNGISFSSVPGG